VASNVTEGKNLVSLSNGNLEEKLKAILGSLREACVSRSTQKKAPRSLGLFERKWGMFVVRVLI